LQIQKGDQFRKKAIIKAILITFGADSISHTIRLPGGEWLNLREQGSGFVNSRFDVFL
jgi:hypothetical protein